METQAERLRDTDTEFTFHWEWTRMRLVIMFNSTVSVSLWQRYCLYTYACCTCCRCSAHCGIHPQVLRWPLKSRRNSTENNSTYPATRPVQLERSGLSQLPGVGGGAYSPAAISGAQRLFKPTSFYCPTRFSLTPGSKECTCG